jgi:predicted nucleic acid-binding protein
MYVAGADHPLRDPARQFLERARRGEVEICTSTEVLQEILYRYAALKRVDIATTVYDLFVQLCPVVFPVTLADTTAPGPCCRRRRASACATPSTPP